MSESEDDNVTYAQLKLVTRFVKLCGFKGLMDYDARVSAKDIKNVGTASFDQFAKEIDKLFPVHEINLRRTDFRFTSETLVMNVLRSLLTFVGVRWKSRRTKDTIYISLIPEDEQEQTAAYIQHLNFKDAIADTDATEYILPVEHVVLPHYDRDTVALVFRTSNTKWLLNNIKTLTVHLQEFNGTNRDSLLEGKTYYIFIGGSPVYKGTYSSTHSNIFPVTHVPLRLAKYMETAFVFDVDIPTDLVPCLKLVCKLKTYTCDKTSEEMVIISWEGSNTLRFIANLAGLAYQIQLDDDLRHKTDIFNNSHGSKIVRVLYAKEFYNRIRIPCNTYPISSGIPLKTLSDIKDAFAVVEDAECKFIPSEQVIYVHYSILRGAGDALTSFEILCGDELPQPKISLNGVDIGLATKTETGYAYPKYDHDTCLSAINDGVVEIGNLIPNKQYILKLDRVYINYEARLAICKSPPSTNIKLVAG